VSNSTLPAAPFSAPLSTSPAPPSYFSAPTDFPLFSISGAAATVFRFAMS
jgi:hypothetical protein